MIKMSALDEKLTDLQARLRVKGFSMSIAPGINGELLIFEKNDVKTSVERFVFNREPNNYLENLVENGHNDFLKGNTSMTQILSLNYVDVDSVLGKFVKIKLFGVPHTFNYKIMGITENGTAFDGHNDESLNMVIRFTQIEYIYGG